MPMVRVRPYGQGHQIRCEAGIQKATAAEKIRELWREGNYIPSPYAQDRMMQRGFTDGDIAYVIEFGRVSSHRKVDSLWRYKVSGKSVDGRRMAVVFEIQGSFMTLFTVHDR
jgi:hypothetical protein